MSQRPKLAFGPATPAECPAGGTVLTIYDDFNDNGIFDFDEAPMSRQTVCNGVSGTNGSQGYSTLFTMNRVSTGLSACVAGSGLQLSSGLDVDRSSALEASEITQAQILCDGVNGAVGSAGPAGSDGYSMVFQSVPASSSACPAGGSVLLMALDTARSGVYHASFPSQQSITLCNGVNGQNGSNGQNGQDAPVPAYAPVEAIRPCGNSVAYKEVLLRLSNGEVLASFSADTTGTMTRLAFLPDGTFLNTDASGCQFTLATMGTTRTISWFNQVQMSWSIP